MNEPYYHDHDRDCPPEIVYQYNQADDPDAPPPPQVGPDFRGGTSLLFCVRCGASTAEHEFCPRCGAKRCLSCGD